MSQAQPGPETAPYGAEEAAPSGRGRIRIVFLLPVLIFLALAGLFFIRLFAGDPSVVPSALIGRAAPAIELPALAGLAGRDGTPVPGLASADLVGTDEAPVTIVNVWASWCAPCRIEHPVLMDLAEVEGVRVMGINYKDAPENARRFLGALGNPYDAIGVDANGRTAIDWGVYGVPETFVLDRAGVIRHKHIGPILPQQVEDFMRHVRAAASPAEAAAR